MEEPQGQQNILVRIIIFGVLCLALTSFITGGVDDNTRSTGTNMKATQPVQEPEKVIVSTEYPSVYLVDTTTELQRELYFDTKLKDNYVQWTGIVDSVTVSGGKKVNLHLIHDGGMFTDVSVRLNDNQYENAVMLFEGDQVTYVTKLTRYGSFLGFSGSEGVILEVVRV